MVRLVATQKLRYGAKEYQVGETFEASDKDASVLKAIRKAADAPQQEPARPAPLPRQTSLPPVPASPLAVKPPAAEEPKVEEKVEPAPEPKTAPKVETVEPVPESTTTAASSAASRRTPAEVPKKDPPSEPSVPAASVPTSTSGRIRRTDLRPEE